MIVDEPGYQVYSGDQQFLGWDITPNNPVIAWETRGTAEADFEDEAYPGSNALIGATNLFWQSTSLASQDFNVALDQPTGIFTDYVGIGRHNFGTGNVGVSVFVDAVQVASEFIPEDNSPLLFRFTMRDGVDNVTITLTPEYEPPFMAGVKVGKLIVLPHRLYVGHSPITMGRQTKITSGYSESGEYLGRNVVNETFSTGVTLPNLPPLWYRDKLDPFIQESQTEPFFFGWRPQQYPEEVAYCWMTNNPVPVNQRANGMMSIDLKLGGIAF